MAATKSLLDSSSRTMKNLKFLRIYNLYFFQLATFSINPYYFFFMSFFFIVFSNVFIIFIMFIQFRKYVSGFSPIILTSPFLQSLFKKSLMEGIIKYVQFKIDTKPFLATLLY